MTQPENRPPAAKTGVATGHARLRGRLPGPGDWTQCPRCGLYYLDPDYHQKTDCKNPMPDASDDKP